jgi:hypothetical protein
VNSAGASRAFFVEPFHVRSIVPSGNRPFEIRARSSSASASEMRSSSRASPSATLRFPTHSAFVKIVLGRPGEVEVPPLRGRSGAKSLERSLRRSYNHMGPASDEVAHMRWLYYLFGFANSRTPLPRRSSREVLTARAGTGARTGRRGSTPGLGRVSFWRVTVCLGVVGALVPIAFAGTAWATKTRRNINGPLGTHGGGGLLGVRPFTLNPIAVIRCRTRTECHGGPLHQPSFLARTHSPVPACTPARGTSRW